MGLPGGENMAETLTLEMSDQERRAWERRAATLAARLMWCCLGIPSEPAFDVTDPNGADTPKVKLEPYGIGLFKDAFDFSMDGEKVELQLLVTDEKGLIKAESRQFFPLGHGLDLLARLPLPLSPRAQRWLKDALGEAGPNTGQASQGSVTSSDVRIGKEIEKRC
jgi:hypothetical protein